MADMMIRLRSCLILFVTVISMLSMNALTTQADEMKFFETHIRPVLVKYCYECHSAKAKKLGGKLYLDTREGMLRGGESGPVIRTDKPEESLLLLSLRGHGDLEMPPKKKLPEAIIHHFEQWIKSGAPDPRQHKKVATPARKFNLEDESLWSFRAIKNPAVPAVKDKDWANDPIDQFILAKLEGAGHRPTADASAGVLARRLYFDLVGLAPNYEQLKEFEQAYHKDAKQAVSRLVDELLASPQFGERWGRHWLDVARYGESNGDDGLGRNATFPHAWRYRDYVIRAFNEDIPYDRFLTEQIAGDLLPVSTAEQRNRQLTATGFLAIGYKPAKAMNNLFAMDVVDDQINVVSTGIMGLSVACARCHDHKHDPISTKDYYAMAGIFTSTETLWGKAANQALTAPPTPLHELRSTLEPPKQTKTPPRFAADYPSVINSLQPLFYNDLKSQPEDIEVEKGIKFTAENYASLENGRMRLDKPVSVDRYTVSFWFRNDLENNKRAITTYMFSHAAGGDTKQIGDHLAIMGTHENKNTGKLYVWNGTGKNEMLYGSTVIPPGVWHHVVLIRDGRKVKLYLNGNSKAEIEGESTPVAPAGRQVFIGARNDNFAPLQGALAHVAVFNRAVNGNEAQQLHAASGQPAGTAKAYQPDYAMGVREAKKIADCKIHIGGARKFGPTVKRGFLPACETVCPAPEISPQTSGRLELAQWLTSGKHPQTARVMVNRIWLHLFGRGIVTTPNDFGVYGARPSHPALLDHLASRFMADDWSMKRMIRTIVLSRTYQLASSCEARLLRADSNNVLLGRHSRRRLDAESLRDRMLQASGNLKLEPAEGSVIAEVDSLLNWPPGESKFLHKPSNHRSIYLCMLRDSLPPELAAFDLPEGRKMIGQRNVTTSPSQVLYLLNNPFVVEQSIALGRRLLNNKALSDEERVTEAYVRCLQREPSARELSRALAHIRGFDESGPQDDPVRAWASFSQALLISTEFRYVD